jgi:cell division protein FtsQ
MTPNTRNNEPTKSEQIARRVLLNTRKRLEVKGKNLKAAGKIFVSLSRRLAWVVGVVVLLLGVVYGASHGWEAAKESQYFTIAEVKITGNKKLTRDELLEVMHLNVSQNVLRYDVVAAANALLALPYVAKAEVVRELPDHLIVNIQERKPLAIIALNALYLVDEEGVLFKRLEAGETAELPVVTGVSREVLHEKGTSPELMAAVHAVQALQRLDAFTRFEIGEIFINSDLSIGLVLGAQGLRVSLGNIEADGFGLAQRLERLVRVLAVADQHKMDVQEISLDNNTRPERVAVKLNYSK